VVRLNVWRRIANAWNALRGYGVSLYDDEMLDMLGITTRSRKMLSEVTYFTCLKMLSETMGKLPLKYYQETEQGRIRAAPTDTTYILTVRPNDYMSPSTLWGTAELNCQHYGNGFIWLHREFKRNTYGGEYKTIDAWVMQSNCVTAIMDDRGIFGTKGKMYYRYSDPRSGEQYLFRNEDVIHIKTWFTLDGFMGEPVRKILEYTIDGANQSQTYMNNLYKSGLTASMALQYSSVIEDGEVKKLQKKYAKYLEGPENAGKVVPVPVGLTLQPIKMSLVDAQFFELKKYSALQIAGAFGIKPNQINNYEKSSYANSEMQQLAFLVDTMSYRLKQYEEEINAKALLPKEIKEGYIYKFNEKAILRTDSKSQMESLKGAVNNGIYTPNEARAFLDMPWKEGGDRLMVNGNYIPITDVGKQYEGGKTTDGNTGD
jgi:HK97 family phage portal protein